MLSQLVLAAVERGVNPLLGTDSVTLQRLSGLSGKVIEVRATSPSFSLYLIPHAEGIQLAQHWEAEPACVLTASASQLLQLALSDTKTSILHQDGVQIEGNSGVLLELAEILQDLQLDWPYLLQQWVGPLAAGILTSAAHSSTEWTRQSAKSLQANLADFLAEESRLLVGNNEAQLCFEQLDKTKLQLDKLEARVNLLTQRMHS